MIEASDFVGAARARGFGWYSGVPCSYLTSFIDHVQQDPALRWIPAANEGDAVATIAGVALAGARGVSMMQNSGLGNAVSPLTSLTWTFRLPQLLIVTWRGEPGVPDEPQHALMGPITPSLLERMEIAWETFPTDAAAIGPALDRAVGHMERTGLPYALLMKKGSVGPTPGARASSKRLRVRVPAAVRSEGPGSVTRAEALARVVRCTPTASTVLVASTGYCGRELAAFDDRPNHLYLVGSMGCATSVAFGLAVARPDRTVIAIDGDGAALMRMGAFATLGACGPPNLVHLLLDNAVHDSTGGQATVSPQLSFAGVASACGYASAVEGDDLDLIDELFALPQLDGPRFLGLAIARGTRADLPRPSVAPIDVKARLMRHLGDR